MTIRPDSHLRDDGDRRIHFVSGKNPLLDLVHIRERLENKQITPAVLERLELFTEPGARFVETGGAEWLETNSERTNGAGDEDVIFRDVARKFRRGSVDLADLRLEPILGQLDPVGTEGICLQHFRPGFLVRLVNIAHEVWGADVQLVVALVDEHALVVKHRAHPTVEDDDLLRVEEAGDQRVLRQRLPPAHSKRLRRCRAPRSTWLQDDG